jgi:uncharacterized membrane protein YeaQ/YmgE (transglycosylase-associated protein family)
MTFVVGAIVGWLASALMKTDARMGIPANVAAGIVGSVLAGAIATGLGMGLTSQVGELVVAVFGACVLIGVLRALGVFDRFVATR